MDVNLKEFKNVALRAADDDKCLSEIHGKTDPEYIVCAEVLRLHEVNQELLEALKKLIDMDVAYQRGDKVAQAVESAKAAIAKVTGEQA